MSRSGSRVVRNFVLAGALFFGGENIGNAQDIQRIYGSSSPDKAVELVSLKTVQDPVAPVRPARDASRMGAVERQETVVALGEVLSIGKIENMISRGELVLPINRGVAVFGTNQNILGSSPDWQRSVLLAFRAGKEDSTSNLRLLDFCRRYILAAEIQIAAGQDMDVLVRNIGATNHTIRFSDLVSMVKSTLTAGLISPKLPDVQTPDGLGSGGADTSVDLGVVQSFLGFYGVSLPGLEDPKR